MDAQVFKRKPCETLHDVHQVPVKGIGQVTICLRCRCVLKPPDHGLDGFYVDWLVEDALAIRGSE